MLKMEKASVPSGSRSWGGSTILRIEEKMLEETEKQGRSTEKGEGKKQNKKKNSRSSQ